MTPKEKAVKLCDAFYQKLPLEMHVITTDGDLSWEYNSWENAKESALILVNEIIEWIDPEIWGIEMDIAFDRLAYWLDVKQEIRNL